MYKIIFKFRVIFFVILLPILYICFSNHNLYTSNETSIQQDTGILRTDVNGNILGGDISDWDFDDENYKKVQLYSKYFQEPLILKKGEIQTFVPETSSFYSEVDNDNVILRWFAVEKDCERYEVERAEKKSEFDKPNWKKVGFIRGSGYNDTQVKYKYYDKDLKFGTYVYRLKQIDKKGNYMYYSLSNDVNVLDYPDDFEFYPVNPNPVIDTFSVRFFLPEKDNVTLFFLNGKDTTYLLNKEPQEKGFYKLTLDKKSFGFNNDIKRLYINCKSCNRKKNFGDIKF